MADEINVTFDKGTITNVSVSSRDDINVEIARDDINVEIDRILYIKVPQGGTNVTGFVTSENINIHRLVAVNADGTIRYASNDDLTTMNRVIGLSLQSVNMGGYCEVLRHGEVHDPSFNFSGTNLYVGANGMITTIPPTSGYLQVVGTVINATTIYIDIFEPLQLS